MNFSEEEDSDSCIDSGDEEESDNEIVRRSYEDVDSDSDMGEAVNVAYAPNTEVTTIVVEKDQPVSHGPRKHDGIDTSDSETDKSDRESTESPSDDDIAMEEASDVSGAKSPRVPAESFAWAVEDQLIARAVEDQFIARAAAERERNVRRLAAALQELDRALAEHAASSSDYALESVLEDRRAAGERGAAMPTANLSFCVVVYLLVYLEIIFFCCL